MSEAQTTETTAETTADQTTETTTETTEQTTTGGLGDNWRETLAGGNEDHAKLLSGMGSVNDVVKKMFNQEKVIAEGSHKAFTLPDDKASDGARQSFRERVGSGANADEYFSALPEGEIVGEVDRGLFDTIAGVAADNYVPKETLSKIYKGYNEYVAKYVQEREATDATSKRENDATLQAEWRGDFDIHNKTIDTMIDSSEVSETLRTARDGDDKLLMDNPEFRKFLLSKHLEAHPIVPIPQGATDGRDVDSELAEMDTMYLKNPDKFNLPENRKRYSELMAYKTSKK